MQAVAQPSVVSVVACRSGESGRKMLGGRRRRSAHIVCLPIGLELAPICLCYNRSRSGQRGLDFGITVVELVEMVAWHLQTPLG